MQPSSTVVNFIKKQEGFAPHAYLDPPHNTRGLYSIGYGHQIQPNEKILMTKTLTEPEASLMLDADMRYYVNQTNLAFKRLPPQGLFDAAVDLAYNAGVGAMQKTVSVWNATGDSTLTANHLGEYRISGGAVNPNLVKRRSLEAGWFGQAVAEVEKKSTT